MIVKIKELNEMKLIQNTKNEYCHIIVLAFTNRVYGSIGIIDQNFLALVEIQAYDAILLRGAWCILFTAKCQGMQRKVITLRSARYIFIYAYKHTITHGFFL